MYDLPVDSNTLNLYTVAAGLSICLSLVMAIFSYFQASTPLIGRFALGLLLMTIGFFLAGIGPLLPAWMRVVVANLVLISAGPILHTGVIAYCKGAKPRTDAWGWIIVAASAPAFWYWGLIDPNGPYRSVVFSLAVVLLYVRGAHALVRAGFNRIGGAPTWALAGLFCTLVVWMTLRCVHLLIADLPPVDARAANPTQWLTVFGYIALASLTAVCVMWMEANRQQETSPHEAQRIGPFLAFLEYFRNKLLLLWSAVIVMTFAMIGALSISYVNFHDYEKARLTQTATTINDAFVEHTQQVIAQTEMMLNAVSAFYIRTDSIPETQAFIRGLGFDLSILENIYLLSADGLAVITHDPVTLNRSVVDREYFLYHQANPGPEIRLSRLETGRVTGKIFFRITRRVNRPDGSFGGVVLATVRSESFTGYFRDLLGKEASFAALLDTANHSYIASVPEIAPERWEDRVDSPIWQALETAPSGQLSTTSFIDGANVQAMYRTVPKLPLVMMTGYSAATLAQSVNDRLQHISLIAATILAFVLMLGVLFTLEAKRRDEQDRFMSMLSHELKTPMSVIHMMLGTGGVPGPVKDRVERSVADMNLIIERCLQSDRLRFGRVRWWPEPCQLADILEEVREQCAEPARVTLDAQDLPSCTTDAQLVRMIVGNLVDNALKYAAPGSPIKVTATAGIRRKRKGIAIEVVNSIGTAGAPDPKRVFGKYYRGERARGKTGSGLGLHIAAGFASKLGGSIRYQPSDTEVRFHLWIPG